MGNRSFVMIARLAARRLNLAGARPSRMAVRKATDFTHSSADAMQDALLVGIWVWCVSRWATNGIPLSGPLHSVNILEESNLSTTKDSLPSQSSLQPSNSPDSKYETLFIRTVSSFVRHPVGFSPT